MNIDAILGAFDRHGVRCLLIGGVNYLLRHIPENTYDIDLWIDDSDTNLAQANAALIELGAEWGRTEKEWAPVPSEASWLRRQTLFCMTTPSGALDLFREVRGLEGQFDACYARSVAERTSAGVPYRGLSDEDMLRCQEALPEQERKPGRIKTLRDAISRHGS